jgi:predicted nucleotidyltransferase
MRSKEAQVLGVLFNSSRQWRFEELRRDSGITRPQLSRWLKKFEKEGIIQRIKRKGEMPHYLADFHNPGYEIRKRLYAFNLLAGSGFLSHLLSLDKAQVIVIFGSFARSDWFNLSDIDVFIYGSDKGLNKEDFELKLARDIQVHLAKNRQDLISMDKLLPYVLNGIFVKGNMADLGVSIHA